MNSKKTTELAIAFLNREKVDVDDSYFLKLCKTDVEKIKLWALCRGMGSEADIYVINEDGSVLHYDNNKLYGYGNRTDKFLRIRDILNEQGVLWEHIHCQFNNCLLIRSSDKTWLESLYEDLRVPFVAQPYACLECVCQNLLK